MLTTTIDGLWVLKVLSGTEVLAPEAGLRPHLPSMETRQLALAHPIAAELRAAGVIDGAGDIDQTVLEWLAVLARRDVGLVIQARTPGSQGLDVSVLARFAHWWASLERSGNLVRLAGIGMATTEQSAGLIIRSQLERLCGRMAPAALKPVTVDIPQLLGNVGSAATLRRFLVDHGLDGDQIGFLTLAADRDRSAQTSIVAVQSGMPTGPARCHIDRGAVTMIDTPQGRLLCEYVSRAGRDWMVVSPGAITAVTEAIQKMMRRLPAENDWHSYRKAV